MISRMTGTNIRTAAAVTTHNTNPLPGVEGQGPAQFLYVGGAGDVSVVSYEATILFTGLAAGIWHAMPPFTHVRTTDTTATGIVAGY